jgi:hypothetical protein
MKTPSIERPAAPAATRRPYTPPTILNADELSFETRLQCISAKTTPCAPVGCASVRAS